MRVLPVPLVPLAASALKVQRASLVLLAQPGQRALQEPKASQARRVFPVWLERRATLASVVPPAQRARLARKASKATQEQLAPLGRKARRGQLDLLALRATPD